MENATTLLETSKVPGTPVFNTIAEPIGEVDELEIDTTTGKVRYAVMSFGGVLGIGKSHYPIPWLAMKWDAALQGYVTGVTVEQLENAPAGSSWSDRDWETKIHTNYGAPAYW